MHSEKFMMGVLWTLFGAGLPRRNEMAARLFGPEHRLIQLEGGVPPATLQFRKLCL